MKSRSKVQRDPEFLLRRAQHWLEAQFWEPEGYRARQLGFIRNSPAQIHLAQCVDLIDVCVALVLKPSPSRIRERAEVGLLLQNSPGFDAVQYLANFPDERAVLNVQ
jgi:hypothetical protein